MIRGLGGLQSNASAAKEGTMLRGVGGKQCLTVKEFLLQGVARGASPHPNSPSPEDLLPSALLTSFPLSSSSMPSRMVLHLCSTPAEPSSRTPAEVLSLECTSLPPSQARQPPVAVSYPEDKAHAPQLGPFLAWSTSPAFSPEALPRCIQTPTT